MDEYTEMYGPTDFGEEYEVDTLGRRVKVDWIEFNGSSVAGIYSAGVYGVFCALGGKFDEDTPHLVIVPDSDTGRISIDVYKLLDQFIEALKSNGVTGWSIRCCNTTVYDDTPWFLCISDLIDRVERVQLLEDLQDAEFRVASIKEQFNRLAKAAGDYAACTMREGWEKGPTEEEALSELFRTLYSVGVDPHRILDEWSIG